MSTRGNDQTYYEILEVPTSAQQHEIVAAYQRAKEAYAPDSPALYTMFTKEEAAELRKLVEEAFLVLGNQSKRREYDQVLVARNHTAQKVELPDFAPESPMVSTSPHERASNVAAFVQNSRSAKTPGPAAQPTSIPAGFARSRLSVYEVSAAVEEEIAKQTSFTGAFLRKVRQYKNINIDQLSKETRIGRSYLVAIESEDAEALPAPVFVRGFLVQLARVLGLNEELVAKSYMEKSKTKG